MKVMLVDDHAPTLKMQAMLFEHDGWTVVTVNDAPTAFHKAVEEQPDLVVLDLSMPGRDGLEVLVQLRLRHPCRVLVLSGFEKSRLWNVVQKLGASAYIEKGAEPEDILLAARDVMAAPLPPVTPAEALQIRMTELV